jgi:hypothetical protein
MDSSLFPATAQGTASLLPDAHILCYRPLLQRLLIQPDKITERVIRCICISVEADSIAHSALSRGLIDDQRLAGSRR